MIKDYHNITHWRESFETGRSAQTLPVCVEHLSSLIYFALLILVVAKFKIQDIQHIVNTLDRF